MVTMVNVIPDPRPALPQNNPASRRMLGDAVALLLLCLQLGLWGATFVFLALMVMGTDACAYQACGDQAWLGRALCLDGYGGAALIVVVGAGTLFRIVRDRLAWFVPLLGCLAQLGLGLVCWAMEIQAGPLVH